MAFLRSTVRFGALAAVVALGSGALGAQQPGRVIAAPRGQQRIASIAPPPSTQTVPNYQYGETVFGNLPAIFTSDGRVLVNFGYGYEQIARTCPYEYGYGCASYGYAMAPQTPVFGPYGPTQYVPQQYMPPAYGAPQYPSGGYPQSGAYYQPPRSYPAGNGCPPGYVSTGTYPPCVDPSRSPSTTLTVAAPAPGPSAAPARRPAGPAAAAPAARSPAAARRP